MWPPERRPGQAARGSLQSPHLPEQREPSAARPCCSPRWAAAGRGPWDHAPGSSSLRHPPVTPTEARPSPPAAACCPPGLGFSPSPAEAGGWPGAVWWGRCLPQCGMRAKGPRVYPRQKEISVLRGFPLPFLSLSCPVQPVTSSSRLWNVLKKLKLGESFPGFEPWRYCPVKKGGETESSGWEKWFWVRKSEVVWVDIWTTWPATLYYIQWFVFWSDIKKFLQPFDEYRN